ncbi:E3 ubiquitin-protein ligase RFWD3-like [Drosophila miranda]|uniref:E3 ubiquitin-protein ligase RFWD3-like n=1 Tax=Drosophila miranda TaxID=7229 RepID=UPI0007E7C6CE|nr:E3 ubiquitin-protein ligase RFWD3-like [Drosophila miranda]
MFQIFLIFVRIYFHYKNYTKNFKMNRTNSNGGPDPPRDLNLRSRAIVRSIRRINPFDRTRQAELMTALDQERIKNRDLAAENEDLKLQLQEQTLNVAQLENRLHEMQLAPRTDQSEGVLIPNCIICYEGWDMSGPHRMISLKCGHFFGDSCIRNYLGRGRLNCPVCRQTAITFDIRYMYIDI